MQLSVLDQSPVRSGGNAHDALVETVRLAQACEALGYSRYWLAEHHGTDGFADSAPEIMIGHVAAQTSRIRVGSGGVMLSHYSPLKVAETFRLLELLHPGRIDLGIGRAPGSDQITAAALACGSPVGIEYFGARIGDLAAFLTDTAPTTEAFATVRATPRAAGVPGLWLLGSSDQSAAYAAHFGLAYSHAHFINPADGEMVVEGYRAHFRPSALYPEPRTNAGVFVIVAETEAEADRLATSRDLWRLRLDRGELGPYPSVEEALGYPYSAEERARVARYRSRSFVGTPDAVRRRLDAMAAAYGIAELVILTITHSFAARLRSYELLARAFGLC
ncbi:MAG: LLM class flavin-dependent oxidoreductase [Alphaproteobacteria bacterium]|nr:LLM class flavin-dependent oxidoreductase [Alphaproteobacteria bacterium]